jgi:hypothetical protein
MKLFIPTIGSRLKIIAPWTFRLYTEYRNSGFGQLAGLADEHGHWTAGGGRYCDPKVAAYVTILPGSLLTVDRVYIRRGLHNFDSLTFYLKPDGRAPRELEIRTTKSEPRFVKINSKAGMRFWAKLADVNSLEVEVIEAVGELFSPPLAEFEEV